MKGSDVLKEEQSEEIVARIREHVVLAEATQGSDPGAARHHWECADELMDRLWKRHYKDAKRAACRAFGTADDRYKEAVGEAASELTRIILRPTGSLRGLDKMFLAAFKNVCLDGIKRVGNVYRDRIGGKTTLETSVGSREVTVVSADSTAVDQWGEEIDPISLRVEDARAIEQFQDVIGHEAYKAIAPFLPPRQRAVLEMRVQNQEFKQIAMCLNIHPETASSNFEKAVQFIETKLAACQREGR